MLLELEAEISDLQRELADTEDPEKADMLRQIIADLTRQLDDYTRYRRIEATNRWRLVWGRTGVPYLNTISRP